MSGGALFPRPFNGHLAAAPAAEEEGTRGGDRVELSGSTSASGVFLLGGRGFAGKSAAALMRAGTTRVAREYLNSTS